MGILLSYAVRHYGKMPMLKFAALLFTWMVPFSTVIINEAKAASYYYVKVWKLDAKTVEHGPLLYTLKDSEHFKWAIKNASGKTVFVTGMDPLKKTFQLPTLPPDYYKVGVYVRGPGKFLAISNLVTLQVAAAVPVPASNPQFVLKASISNNRACAIVADKKPDSGVVWCWGVILKPIELNGKYQKMSGNIGDPWPMVKSLGNTSYFEAKDIAVGSYHSCALTVDGQVYCWGLAADGKLGIGVTTGDYSNFPLAVMKSDGTPLNGIKKIVAGGEFTCALHLDSTVYCWGNNSFGTMGNGEATQASSHWAAIPPTTESGAPLTGIAEITAGGSSLCAVSMNSNQPTLCWGNAAAGNLGIGKGALSVPQVYSVSIPTEAPGLNSTLDIGMGLNQSCTQSGNSVVRCYGSNEWFANGNPVADFMKVKPCYGLSCAYTLHFNEVISDLEAGTSHNCVLLSSGKLRCWGQNWYGNLGNGQTTNIDPNGQWGMAGIAEPQKVVLKSGQELANIISVTAGTGNTCAVDLSGTLYCWGAGFSGILGNVTAYGKDAKVPYAVPVQFTGP